MARLGTFRSLRQRNAKLFFAGMLVSNCGTWMQATAQGWLVYRLSGQGTSLGLVLACQFLPLLVLGPWAGVLADRMNRRRLTIATQAGMAAQAILLGVLDLTGLVTLPLVYGLALVLGVLSAIDNPARRSLVTELVDEEDIPNVLSLNTAVMTGSRGVRPGARRTARRSHRHRLVLHGQRSVVLRRAGQPPAPQPGAAAHRGSGTAGRQAVAGGAALRLAGPGAALDLRDLDDRLDLRLQLRRLAAARGIPQPRWRRGRVRAAAGRHQRGQLHGVAGDRLAAPRGQRGRCSARSPSSACSRR